MLLRRITEHVKAQNWTAIFLDFIIVVIGVFIGIQLGNWNEAQHDRRLERTFLERMHTELVVREAAHKRVAEEERRVREDLYNIRLLLVGLAEMRPLSAAECSAVSRSGATPLPEVGVPIIDELVSTGRLDLLSNPKIRRGASAVYQLRSMRENSFNTFLRNGAGLVRNYPELLPYSLVPAEDPDDEDGYSPAFTCDPQAMIANRAFVNDFAQNVSNYATAGNLIRANAETIDDLHNALDRELGIDHRGESE